ncbi:MAG: elongation factor G [Acidimicrobiales bacterium]
MKVYPPAQVRNVALVGHGGSGKTTLAEALLHCAGVVGRPGRVEDGTTVTDFEPEEHKHRISVQVGMAPFEWHDHKVNLLDCPGYADFATEAETALRVADLAVFVVSAVEGVEVQTEMMWRAATELGLPRMVFVNKLDRERASFTRTLEQLQSVFGAGIAPLELPIGEESSFRGVADLLSDTGITYDSGQPVTGPVPDEMEEAEHAVHDSLVEGIVVADDDLMERYLDGDTPSVAELEKTLAHGVASAQVFPVVCGSASRRIAVDRLASFICELGPSPLDRPAVTVHAGDPDAGGLGVEVEPDPAGTTLAWVWKTMADPFVGKISLFKVLSGTVVPDAALGNSRTRSEERLHAAFSLRGKEQVPVSQIPAGDFGAVAKLTSVVTGDTLAGRGAPVTIPVTPPPDPVLAVAITPRSKGDEDKLMTALHRLTEEDPALRVRRDDETHQTLLAGMGETHLAVAAERLARLGVQVETSEMIVPYRETISAASEAEGKYKKQTGGHGQYGVASVRLEPRDRGAGFEFVDKIVGGVIPRQLIPAVAKGIEEAMASGGAFGYPVVDLRAICFDGKYHPVDSSEMSFKMAGALAFREALAKAQPVLLEPVSHLEVTVPDQFQGDVMGDLNSRRGRVQGSEGVGGGESAVTALVPTSELTRYAIDLRSMTGGRGRFRAGHERYDPVPPHLADKVRRDPGG